MKTEIIEKFMAEKDNFDKIMLTKYFSAEEYIEEEESFVKKFESENNVKIVFGYLGDIEDVIIK